MRSVKSADSDEELDVNIDSDSDDDGGVATKPAIGLSTTGFDWTGATLDADETKVSSGDDSDDGVSKKKRRHKKATIKEDRTGDLDAFGPQSVADYERLLLGQPNNAELWVRYMVFQRELNEIEKARQIARRALATMNPREEKERLDVWTALLHLENDFGSDDLIDETFKEACQNNDSREMHERMIKIYISSAKLDVSPALSLPSVRSPHTNAQTESRQPLSVDDEEQVLHTRPRPLALICHIPPHHPHAVLAGARTRLAPPRHAKRSSAPAPLSHAEVCGAGVQERRS
jgi:tetratricopeptide (TPR) repeat protein